MKKHMLLFLFTLPIAMGLQAQILNRIKNKVNQAVNNSVDRSVDKVIDKTVSKPVDATVDKALSPQTNSTGQSSTTGKPAGASQAGSATASTPNKDDVKTYAAASFPAGANVVDRPTFLTADHRDFLYVIDQEGMVVFHPDGSMKRFTLRTGFTAVSPNGQMYGTLGGTIQRLEYDGKDNLQMTYFAGDKNYGGYRDGPLANAQFNNVVGMVVTGNGDIYLADVASSFIKAHGGIKNEKLLLEAEVPARLRTDNSWDYWCVIRKISNGKVTTLQNSQGQYLLLCLAGMDIDREGNLVYSGGGFSRAVRKLDLQTMQISTIAGKPYKREWCPVYTVGDTSKAELFDPQFVRIDPKGDVTYADGRNHRITKIAHGTVSTLAGNNVIQECGANIGGRAHEGHQDGKAATALFNFPKSMAYDSKGNLYIVDKENAVVRKLSPDGMVSTFTTFDPAKARINR